MATSSFKPGAVAEPSGYAEVIGDSGAAQEVELLRKAAGVTCAHCSNRNHDPGTVITGERLCVAT